MTAPKRIPKREPRMRARAVNSGRVLEASLGYYIIPLIAMGAGALLFHERIDRLGATSIALAALGVALQAVADLGEVRGVQ